MEYELLMWTSIIGVAGYIIGAYFSQEKWIPFGRNRAILKEQLVNVFSPMMYHIESSEKGLFFEKAAKISEDHFELVPENLWAALLEYKANQSEDNYEEIVKICVSDFNWTKKKLGYEYIDSRINTSLLPYKDQKHNRNLIASAAFSGLGMIPLFITILYMLLPDPESFFNSVPLIVRIIMILFIPLAFLWVFYMIVIATKAIAEKRELRRKRKTQK